MQQRPNILLICSDQQNWRMNGFNGHPLVLTPHMDRLAARGVNCRICYSPSPVCCPARAACFTGRLPHELGAYDNAAPFGGQVPTFGNLARERGYRTFATGKLDFHRGRDYGFHEHRTFHGHDVNPDISAFFRNPICRFEAMGDMHTGTVCEEDDARRLHDHHSTRHAISFLESAGRDAPWFCYVGWNYPHAPYRTTRAMFERYPPAAVDLPRFPADWRDREHPVMALTRYHILAQRPAAEADLRLARSAYYGMIAEVDDLLGLLLEALERNGQRDNTVILFTSDHGEMIGEHGLWAKNVPLEDSQRVPLLLAGPGLPSGRRIDTPVSLLDVFATITDLVGAPPPAQTRGQSLLPLIRGESDGPPHVYSELNTERLITGVFTIRRGDWKYNYYVGYPDQLFNLAEDPDEWNDLSRDCAAADVRTELRERLFAMVDPDRVHVEAQRDQQRRLDAMMSGKNSEAFVDICRSRLGEAQSRELARIYFAGRSVRSRTGAQGK